jgi:hypothetical protein
MTNQSKKVIQIFKIIFLNKTYKHSVIGSSLTRRFESENVPKGGQAKD